MSTLVNALKKKALSNRSDLQQQSAITETQRLLTQGGAEDYQMLKEMGMHKAVEQAQEIHGKRMELENLETKYGQVYSISEIEGIACRYALKFRRSDQYQGPVDPEMLQKIKEFFKDSGIETNGTTYGHKFFVLAPPKAFPLTDRPVPRPPDPILFYKLDEENYRFIHKWGSDLTIFRRILGFKYMNKFTYWLTWFLVLSIPAITSWYLFTKTKGELSGSFLFMFVLFVIGSTTISIWRALDSGWGGEFYNWKELWMNGFKPKF